MTGHVPRSPIGETETDRRRRAQAIGAETRRSLEGYGRLRTLTGQLYQAYGGWGVPSTRRKE